MSNYYQTYCHHVGDLKPEERAWLERAVPRFESVYYEADEEFFKSVLNKDGWYLESDEGYPVDPAAEVLQRFLKRWRPDEVHVISWANTSDRMLPDADGGGAVTVTADEQYWFSAVNDAYRIKEDLEANPLKYKYLASKGVRCLFCDSYNIGSVKTDYDAGFIYQNVECADCGGAWQETNTLTDIEVIHDPRQ